MSRSLLIASQDSIATTGRVQVSARTLWFSTETAVLLLVPQFFGVGIFEISVVFERRLEDLGFAQCDRTHSFARRFRVTVLPLLVIRKMEDSPAGRRLLCQIDSG